MQVSWALRPKVGEVACGDHVTAVHHGDTTLLAVIDGLGHGPPAAEASSAAAAFVSAHPDLPLDRLLQQCDRAISHTRGVAMALVRLELATLKMQHASVGNVELLAVSAERVRPICYPGVVGARFRRVMTAEFQLHAGDRLAIFTDGVSSRMDLEELPRADAQTLADTILRRHGKDHDDAACAVILC